MENEKDRLGEKLKFDERANEDMYFAAKEHELIEGMKAELQKVEVARREERSCEGIWLDKGELEAILRRALRGPLGAFLERCFSKEETEKKS